MPDIDEKAAELLDQGIIEAMPLAEVVTRLDRSVERQVEVRGITRQPRKEEDEDDEDDERDGAGQAAPSDEITPAVLSSEL